MRVSIFIFMMLLTLASGSCSAEAPDNGLRPFWTQFRQAVIDNDKAAVADMARFPFPVRGADDSDPVKSLDRIGFLNIYERLVAQIVYFPSGGQIISRSMRELIHDAAAPPAADPENGDSMRFHQFEFERIDGRWRLVIAYLEE